MILYALRKVGVDMGNVGIEKVGVYAGSFNPFTNGHLEVVKDAAKLFDKVVICRAANSSKTVREDYDMAVAIRETLEAEGLKNCEVVEIYDMMIADYCRIIGATYLIRALRNSSDYMYEENIAKINYEINPNLTTIYLRSKPNFECVSSSMIRELKKYGKDVSKYLPKAVEEIYCK